MEKKYTIEIVIKKYNYLGEIIGTKTGCFGAIEREEAVKIIDDLDKKFTEGHKFSFDNEEYEVYERSGCTEDMIVLDENGSTLDFYIKDLKPLEELIC